ncbi:AI-2E family transporter [Desmospora activa]|uniref:Putative PurR-regulated permease PerM n=1 Tax=Desmospora activa DSM 45169 TaxID=1121389 RepID=A0A2T4ZDT2_9BACL|nr:AI-2E family transporter [Desmospora activa]PTM60049.1 putative PurR-regulated permease PerM [Desmospora activa DSM 45169]
MPQSKVFRVGYGILLILLIVYVSSLVNFIFRPVIVMFQTLFFPFLVAGVLYYLFRPVVNLLHRKKVPKAVSILVIYLLFIGLITLLVLLVGPTLQEQINKLIDNLPALILEATDQLVALESHPWVQGYLEHYSLEELSNQVTQYVTNEITALITNIAGFVGAIASVVIAFLTVPFILFYMLKEGEKAPKKLILFLPASQRAEGRKILSDMDTALSSYIQGQIIVSVCVGVLIYIGYLIIGLDYALLLAFVALFTNFIPFLGPIIGTIPAIIVAFIDSPLMALWAILITLIAQQIESNLISPQVMGRRLAIHPLTIISILLVAGSLVGFLGLLLAVPTYAVLKVVVSHTYHLIQLRNKRGEETEVLE